MEKSTLDLLENTLELANTVLAKDVRASKEKVVMFVVMIISFTFIICFGLCGYFFSDYSYYELPAIETTNTNSNFNTNLGD